MSKWLNDLEIRTKVAVVVNKRLAGAFIIDEGSFITHARKLANGVFESYVDKKVLSHVPKFNLLYDGEIILLDLSKEEMDSALLSIDIQK